MNLGCGRDLKDGYLNVDVYGNPPVFIHDLNVKPWPWEKDSVDEILMFHVLEHLPDPISVLKEIYRVCKKDALIHIAVPHPFHDDFISDPTHVSRITPRMVQAFSKAYNRKTLENGDANNPLGILSDVDFEIEKHSYVVEKRWMQRVLDGELSEQSLQHAILNFNNVVKQIEMIVRVVK